MSSPRAERRGVEESSRGADYQSRAAHPDDGSGCFEPYRVGRELGDPAGDVCRNPANHLEHEREIAFSRGISEAVQADFAVRTEREPRVVFHREPETPVGAG